MPLWLNKHGELSQIKMFILELKKPKKAFSTSFEINLRRKEGNHPPDAQAFGPDPRAVGNQVE